MAKITMFRLQVTGEHQTQLLVHGFVVGLLPTRLTIGGPIAGLTLLGTAEEAQVWRLKSVETIEIPYVLWFESRFFWAESPFGWGESLCLMPKKNMLWKLWVFNPYFDG